jgi:hypothetical protein
MDFKQSSFNNKEIYVILGMLEAMEKMKSTPKESIVD